MYIRIKIVTHTHTHHIKQAFFHDKFAKEIENQGYDKKNILNPDHVSPADRAVDIKPVGPVMYNITCFTAPGKIYKVRFTTHD